MALIKCEECGKEISDRAKSCPHCGCPNDFSSDNNPIPTPKEELMQCPKCGSTQLSANKKGYSAGKAIAGVVLTGGIGLVAGTFGSNKVTITCLNCGFQFKPGEQSTIEQKEKAKQDSEAVSKRFEEERNQVNTNYDSFKDTDKSTWTKGQQRIAKRVEREQKTKTVCIVAFIIIAIVTMVMFIKYSTV